MLLTMKLSERTPDNCSFKLSCNQNVLILISFTYLSITLRIKCVFVKNTLKLLRAYLLIASHTLSKVRYEQWNQLSEVRINVLLNLPYNQNVLILITFTDLSSTLRLKCVFVKNNLKLFKVMFSLSFYKSYF